MNIRLDEILGNCETGLMAVYRLHRINQLHSYLFFWPE